MEFFLFLLIKHVIVDLGMQSQLQNINKKYYFGNGHIHYIQHGLGTLVVCFLFLPVVPALLCSLADYIIHWQIDYLKHLVNRVFKIENRSTAWWWVNTIDQCLHFITYYYLVTYFSAMSFLIFY